jgi:hypothetical protein
MITPMTNLTGTSRKLQNFFFVANELQQGLRPHSPLPFRTFVGAKTGLHLARDPTYFRMTVDDAAQKFQLLNLRGAIVDYLSKQGVLSGADNAMALPFDMIEAWTTVQVQNYSYHTPNDILPPQTINASPPSVEWPVGHADTVLMNTDLNSIWPRSSLTGISALFDISQQYIYFA